MLVGGSELDVGDLSIAINLQFVDLIEGLHTVGEVKQVLAVHEHLKPLIATADRNIKVLSLCEGVAAELAFLFAPFPTDFTVSHHDAIFDSGVQVEGNVVGSAHYKVYSHPGGSKGHQASDNDGSF